MMKINILSQFRKAYTNDENTLAEEKTTALSSAMRWKLYLHRI